MNFSSDRIAEIFNANKGLEQLEMLPAASPEQLNGLPYGTIRLDSEGRIVSYNMAESNISGRNAKDVLGKNFFTEVAPCTNVVEFAGRFREGVQKRQLHAVFPYKFRFPHKTMQVTITLYYHSGSNSAWVLVRPD